MCVYIERDNVTGARCKHLFWSVCVCKYTIGEDIRRNQIDTYPADWNKFYFLSSIVYHVRVKSRYGYRFYVYISISVIYLDREEKRDQLFSPSSRRGRLINNNRASLSRLKSFHFHRHLVFCFLFFSYHHVSFH